MENDQLHEEDGLILLWFWLTSQCSDIQQNAWDVDGEWNWVSRRVLRQKVVTIIEQFSSMQWMGSRGMLFD